MGDLVELRSLYEGGQLDQAWALYREMDAAGEAGPEVHLLGAKAAQYRGDLFGARWAVERVDQGALAGNVLGQVRFSHGYIVMRLGDVPAAVDQFRAFIADQDRYPDVFGVAEGHVWFNLGFSLRQAMQYDEALDAYHRSAAAHRRNGLFDSLCETLHNLAWTACMVGRRDLALASLEEAAPLCTSDYLRVHQSIGEAFAGVLGDESDRKRALEICQSLIGRYDHVPYTVRSHACWLAGRVSLDLGQLDMAEDLAKKATQYAGHDQTESRCLRDAAELLREVRARRMELQPGA